MACLMLVFVPVVVVVCGGGGMWEGAGLQAQWQIGDPKNPPTHSQKGGRHCRLEPQIHIHTAAALPASWRLQRPPALPCCGHMTHTSAVCYKAEPDERTLGVGRMPLSLLLGDSPASAP